VRSTFNSPALGLLFMELPVFRSDMLRAVLPRLEHNPSPAKNEILNLAHFIRDWCKSTTFFCWYVGTFPFPACPSPIGGRGGVGARRSAPRGGSNKDCHATNKGFVPVKSRYYEP
jgi:hypothetical protein